MDYPGNYRHGSNISARERRWVIAFAAATMLVTTLPYLIGFANQNDLWRFSGFVFGIEDGNSYIAKMLSGANGAWLFRTPYTSFTQNGLFMFLPYLLLGKLAAQPNLHEKLIVLYHLFRIGAGILMIIASYDFLAFYTKYICLRKIGLAVITLGGGLGWILIASGKDNWFGSLPLEFYSPESFGFLALLGIPHLAAARAFLLWSLLAYLYLIRQSEGYIFNKHQVFKLSLYWFLGGLFQPLVAGIIGLIVGIHLVGMLVVRISLKRKGQPVDWHPYWKVVKAILTAGFIPLVFIFYNLIASLADPFMQWWSRQNIITSPIPVHYLFAYGLLLPIAWVGGRRLLRQHFDTGWLIVGWVCFAPLLAYAPVNLQRRLPEGIWVALVTLSICGIEALIEKRSNRQPFTQFVNLRLTLPYLLLFPSTCILILGSISTSLQHVVPVFRPMEEVKMFKRLSTDATPGMVVLASFDSGNVLPAWAPVRVVIGHGPESANLAFLREQVANLYQSAISDETRKALLGDWGVNFVFWGPSERAIGSWNPTESNFLEPIEKVGDYELFAVRKSTNQ